MGFYNLEIQRTQNLLDYFVANRKGERLVGAL